MSSDLAPKTNEELLEERAVHRRALKALQDAGLGPMVGGAYALRCHTGYWRDTKDLDLFLLKTRIHEALAVLEKAGFRTEFTDPLWIAKGFDGPYFVDLIFSSGNGIAIVDADWQRFAGRALVLDLEALVVPAEEMIWSKAFIQERERFDGADIHHLIRGNGSAFDWDRLLRRFDDHWPVLYGHLINFWFAFPSDRGQIPVAVMRELGSRLEAGLSQPVPGEKICRGTLLSRQQYLWELDHCGYLDARELEIADWRGDQTFPRPRKVFGRSANEEKPGRGGEESNADRGGR